LAETVELVRKSQSTEPQAFKHYQDMLGVRALDAVIIATPPHWHALQCIAALERNLDVYCEKPLSYDIREGQAMIAAARRWGRVVQVGFQRRQAAAIRQAREYIRAGNAGKIVNVAAQIHYRAGVVDNTPQTPPATLDWDLWCGPAPKLPYSPQVGHVHWRLEHAFGHGHLVDWGIHLIDATRWVLGEDLPKSVQAVGGLYGLKDRITTPDILTAHFEYASCPVTWRHHIWGGAEYAPEVSNGIFFYGEKETVFVTDNRWIVMPRERNQQSRTNEVSSDAGREHMADFLEAVRLRRMPVCTIEDAWASTTAVHLAMIAYETDRRIVWDAAASEIEENRDAAKLLRRDYRSPWKHPYRS
jgi:predicted dehydrogenase